MNNHFYSDFGNQRKQVARPALIPKHDTRYFVNLDIVPTIGRPAMINEARGNKVIRPQGARAIYGVTPNIRNPFNLELTIDQMNAKKALPALYKEITSKRDENAVNANPMLKEDKLRKMLLELDEYGDKYDNYRNKHPLGTRDNDPTIKYMEDRIHSMTYIIEEMRRGKNSVFTTMIPPNAPLEVAGMAELKANSEA